MANIIRIEGGAAEGTAVAADVLEGKTFTNDDDTFVGTMPNKGTNQKALGAWQGEDVGISIPYGYYAQFPDGGHPFTWVPKNWFGNAYASDVVKGKTFTSQDGYQVVGTNDVVVGQSGNYPNNSESRRSITTTKAYSRCIIVAVGGHGSTPSMSANGGTLTSLYRVYTNNGVYGAGLAVYRGDNIPNGTTITVNFGTAAYGQAITIIEA